MNNLCKNNVLSKQAVMAQIITHNFHTKTNKNQI
jgi:hypothetical protein